MIHFRGIASQIIVFLLVTGAPAAVAVPKKPPLQQTVVPTMSVCQARRTIVTELQQASTGHNSMLQSPPSGVVINAVELAFHAEPNFDKKAFPPAIYKVNLKTLGEVTSYGKAIRISGKDPLNEKSHSHDLVEAVRENLSNSSILAFLEWRKLNYYPDEETPQAFANALNSLRLYARAFDSSTGLSPPCFADKDEQARVWVEFQKRVAAWHSLPARPPLFDAVRKQQLLAEDAVNQKQFEAAAAAYDAGTQIDPMWPEGHFNAAAIYGELKDYDDAVWHMRCYLELMPNASDAKAARDQMLLWQAKAEQQTAQ